MAGIAFPDGTPFLPGDDLHGWHLAGNNGSRAYYGTLANNRTRHNHNSYAKPNITAYQYRLCDSTFTERQGIAVNVMIDGPNHHIRSKNHIVPNG